GGLEEFLERYAVIVMADHSQAPVSHAVDLRAALAELDVLGPGRSGRSSASPARGGGGETARIAVCPTQRAAMVYLLGEHRREELRSEVVRKALQLDGVELVMWLTRDEHGAPLEASIARPSVGELRFGPGDQVADARGARWSLEGELAVLDAAIR